MKTYVIDELAKKAQPLRCIPNADVGNGGAAITLCGWVDVAYTEQEGVPDCPDCLDIVAYCKALDGVPEPPA